MKKIIKIIAIILFFSAHVSGQSSYKIPVGSPDNKINIKVTNPTTNTMNDVRVSLIVSPEWIKFKETEIYLVNISPQSSSNAVFEFDVNNDAPSNEEATISFSIQTKTDQRWLKVFNIETTIPDKFELFQNYPNPFNPNTTIKFSLASDVRVVLKVFNILGETVGILKNDDMKAGIHQVEFNSSGTASGVYFYSIEAGDYMSVKKMLLMK